MRLRDRATFWAVYALCVVLKWAHWVFIGDKEPDED